MELNLNKTISFLCFKYIQYIQIYFFFTNMVGTSYQYVFIGLFCLDKIIRILFIFVVALPNLFQMVGIFVVVLFSFEEIFGLYFQQNNNIHDDEDDDYAVDIPISEMMNISMIPSLIFIIVWLMMSDNEVNIMLAMPCLFLLFLYVNNVWSKKIMDHSNINYAKMIPEYISLFAYFGMIFTCIDTSNFLQIFLSVNILISILITYQHLNKSTQIYSDMIIFVYLFIFINTLLNGGVELRNIGEFNIKNYVSFRVLNFQLAYKLIQIFFLLICLMINYDTISQQISAHFLILIITSALIYSIINLYEKYLYYLYPILVNEQFIQIESQEDLKRYNNLNRQQLLKSNQISEVVFLLNNQPIEYQYFSEYIYCLLSNFQNKELFISFVGKRQINDNTNSNNRNMSVEFDKKIPDKVLDKLFQSYQIDRSIKKIQFNYEVENKRILNIIKDYSQLKQQQQVIYSKNIPKQYINMQQKFLQLQQDIIFREIVFFKYESQYLNVNPQANFYDLYESSLEQLAF